MSCLGWIGEMAEIVRIGTKELLVEWRIRDFPSLPGVGDEYYFSPEFTIGAERWFLTVWPNWDEETPDPLSGWIRIDFVRSDGGPPKTFQIYISISGATGLEMEREVRKEFSPYGGIYLHDFCSRNLLMEHKSRLMPSNMLTVRCVLQSVVSSFTRDVCTQTYSPHGALTETKQSPEETGQRSSDSCIICYEKPVDCVLYRCGHMHMCYNCAFELLISNSSAQCPVCRSIIQDIIKIYK